MRKSKLFMGLLSIAVILVSCSKDENNSIDTSKAIRDGNFLQAADFKDVSVLNIKNSDNYVSEKFEDGTASFKYSIPESRSSKSLSNYNNQTTEIKLNEEILVEFTSGEYVLEFSYCFVLDNPNELREAVQNVYLELYQQEINLIDDDVIPGSIRPLQIGSGGDVPMNDKWSTYRTTLNVNRDYYANINFQLKNISKINNNTFFIRNIQLVKK